MEKKKKILNFIFSVMFILMIFLPFCLLDTTPEISSALENRNLTEWPGFHISGAYNEWYGHYVEDRVGFREWAIRFQTAVSYYVFGEFAEEIHMKGKDGYIFPADEGYIQNYQRININDELLKNLAQYLGRTSAYARENDVAFYAVVCPNKSSVYGQYMPDTIFVDESRRSALDTLKDMLYENGTDYLIPDAEFREKAKTQQIYNIKYDSAHWNDLGAFYGLSLLDEKIAQTYPDILPVSADLFQQEEKTVNLELSTLPMTEKIPILTCREHYAVANDSESRVDVPVLQGNNMAYYYNEQALTDKCILILHDSFLDNKECYYYGRYREVYFASRANYTFMKDYIDKIRPDVIIFEIAERSFADDLYAYTRLGTYSYEE